MSVINQMLRDLDAREASEQERTGLPSRLRTLPPAALGRRQNWRILVLGMAIGALAAGAFVGWYLGQLSPPVVAVPSAPTIAAAPAHTLPPPAAVDDGAMKLSTLIARPEPAKLSAAPAAAVTPAAKAASVPVSEKPPAAEPAKPLAAEPKPKPKVAPSPPASVPAQAIIESAPEPQIDKRNKGGQAHEMAETEYRKGMQAMRRNDPAAALPQFQRALELEPTLVKARQALLSVLVSGRHWAEARQAAENGLALDPAQSAWAVILARLQLEQGDANAAVATLERHAAHARSDADYQGLFAYLLQKQQRPTEAAERFKAALSLRPGEGRWWFGLGVALESAGSGSEAKEAYAKAREIGNLPADMAAIVEQKLR